MSFRQQHRLILLLFLALLAPFLLLTVFGIRMIFQERELDAKRQADERQKLVSQIRQELENRLERIKLQELSARTVYSARMKYQDPSIVLVATIRDDRLILPWEEIPYPADFPRAIGSSAFARKIAEGEQQELKQRQLESAIASYREALKFAKSPAQTAAARLFLARALSKAGRQSEAHHQFKALLALPSSLQDDQGTPFKLYAASQLVREAANAKIVLDSLITLQDDWPWLPPSSCYLIRDLTDNLAKTSQEPSILKTTNVLKQALDRHLREMEQILSLQAAFPRLASTLEPSMPRSSDHESVWIPYGEETWLIGKTSSLPDRPAALIAIRSEPVFKSLQTALLDTATWKAKLTTQDPLALPLGENFPGLKVVVTPGQASPRWTTPQRFYLGAILLALGVTLVGAYLLERDVRREMRVAEMRAQFVSSVSHELKTPLTTIRMFAETLKMRRWNDPSSMEEYLDTIINESQRLTRMVDNILNFSRIERDKMNYQLKPASLAGIVRTAVLAVQYSMAQQKFRLNVELDECLPQVKADADALEQAIVNLLTNAMKFSADSREIDLRLRRANSWGEIQVVDHGIGIAPSEQKRIFDRFYRIPTKENQAVPGTGLGLTLTEHIVKGHHGEIKVESEPGKGSSFSILIPLETSP